MADRKVTNEDRKARIQKRYADSEMKLKRARAAAKKAKIDGDLALLDHIREQTMESMNWDDWDELVSSGIPDNAETILDALSMTGQSIIDERRAEAERKKSEQRRNDAQISDDNEYENDEFR